MFSCEFWEISKNTFFYRTPPDDCSPYGTSNKIFFYDLLFFIFDLYFLVIRQLCANINAIRLKPCACSFASKNLSERQSKAFEKSVKRARKYFPSSTSKFCILRIVERQHCVLQPFQKPH